MEEQLRVLQKRVVGTKQVLRVVRDGKAAHVFLCADADEFIYRQVEAACEAARVPITKVETMEKLGKMCLVGVKTATAALLK
jgi:large subunit ribosomal protein L7A